MDGASYAFHQEYDREGRLLWRTYPDGDGVGSSLDPILYDGSGRLLSVPGVLTQALWDAAGNAVSVTRANGVVTTAAFSDRRGWLETQVTVTAATTTVQNLAYPRDAAGQILLVASIRADESWSYGYDQLLRLVSATNIDTAMLSRAYAYDSPHGVSGATWRATRQSGRTATRPPARPGPMPPHPPAVGPTPTTPPFGCPGAIC
ncbi:MAG: hypothetical protein ACTS3R_00440 [Inquilinaceae bacterium]